MMQSAKKKTRGGAVDVYHYDGCCCAFVTVGCTNESDTLQLHLYVDRIFVFVNTDSQFADVIEYITRLNFDDE